MTVQETLTQLPHTRPMLKKKATKEITSSNDNKTKNEETKKKSKEDKKVIEVKERPKIFHLDFKSLRNVLQQILNKINSLMLPLIKNCRSDKVYIFSCILQIQ